MLKKCREFWSWLKTRLSPKEEEEIEEIEEAKEVFVLGPVKEFFESYIGVIIVGFIAFEDTIEDIETDISAKLVTRVDIVDDHILVRLSKINGSSGGSIKIVPGINGQFAERDSEEKPVASSMWRINFYGSDTVEYIDKDGKGTVSFIKDRAKVVI